MYIWVNAQVFILWGMGFPKQYGANLLNRANGNA
jgi:hypothetical protein